MAESGHDDLPPSLGEVFFRRDAIAAGMSNRRLYQLRDDGVLLPLGGGLYRRAEADAANLDWIEIAERVPDATLCLETALAEHGLIDAIPLRTDVAIPNGAHRPRLQAAHRLHTFDRDTFEVGRELLEVGANRPIGIYSAERSIIDVVRLRHDQGEDMAWESLRRWVAQPGRQPSQLLTMARSHFPKAEPALRRALEVLL